MEHSDTITEAASIEARAWPPMRQYRLLGVIAGGVVVLLILVWFGRRLFVSPPAPEPPPPPAGTFRATAAQLKSLTIQPVALHDFMGVEIADGSIALNGDRTTPVYSPYSGPVTRVIAKPGDLVTAGAPLATVDASEFVQAQNDLITAAAQVKLARANESRKHALYDAQGGSQQDWQQSQADLATAEVALKAVRNRLRILGKSPVEIEALEAGEKVDATATIAAPIAGIVVDREVGPGQYVQAGTGTPAYTVADVSTVWLVANVREDDAPLVHRGQSVEVSVGAYPGRLFTARLTYVAAVVDPNTHKLPVRAEVPNGDGALKPQMLATFRITTGGAQNSPAVPASAVVYEGESAHVWVTQKDGGGAVIGLRQITIGRTDDQLVQVLSGLTPGEQVVTRGSLFIDRAVSGG